jgi:hypothetical protein
MRSKRFVNASRPADLGKRVIVPSCCGISIISSRASRSYRLSLSLSPITALLGLKGLLELLRAGYQLFLLTRRQTVTNTCTSTVQKLPDHGADAALYLSVEDLICELLKSGPEPRKLGL